MKLVKHYVGTSYCDAAFEPFKDKAKPRSGSKLHWQSDYWKPADKPLFGGLRWSAAPRRAGRDCKEYFQ